MISLLTTIYPISSPKRLAEIQHCFEKNAQLDLVEHIFVIAEKISAPEGDYAFFKHPKVTWIEVDRRPTYHDFFSLANEHPGGRFAICNSDVYFDETLSQASGIDSGELWCLCRYNMVTGRWQLQAKGEAGSADAWIFKAPMRDFESRIKIGVLGCDSYLAQKASKAGLLLKNPCRSVIMRHVHCDPERNNTPGGESYWSAPDYKCFCVPPC